MSCTKYGTPHSICDHPDCLDCSDCSDCSDCPAKKPVKKGKVDSGSQTAGWFNLIHPKSGVQVDPESEGSKGERV